jgi:hypothetical protein
VVVVAGDTTTLDPERAPGFQVYVVAPVPVNVVELPEHIVKGAPDAVTVGVGFTVMVTVFGPLGQPVVVPTKVYVVVVPGDTTTLEPERAPGFHVYVVAPVPVNVVEPPEHIVVGAAEAVTVGVGLTVTVTVCGAPVQPAEVPTKVYVVVVAGDTTTLDPERAPGFQV